jgi:signal transduction histidine kinase
MRFLSLAGRLHHGGYLWIGTPLAEIEGSVAIANQFSIFTGIISVFLGGLWVFFYARRFTQPILELNRMAQDMTKLDFKRKYKGKSRDEIDDLGHNINSLSEQLDHSITELREANLQLEVENEYRRKVDEMRKEFISNISHELKTPLALVQGYAEGLELDIAGDQANKDYYCHVILDETKKMDRLVRTLLDLSEIDSGYYQLDLERVDLAEIISHVVEKYKLILEEKGVKLDYQADEDLLIWADPVRIEQVLNNFINNALQHMNEAKRLRIRAISEAGKVRLTVFNSGDPIPEEALEQIWNSFYKVDKARTRTYGGTGLGLTIVRAIVKLHQGNYGVRNLSDGVEFWVEFDSEIGSGA